MKRSLAVSVLMLAVLAALPMAPAQAATTTYHQPNWIIPHTTDIDVLIVPATHGQIVNGDGIMGGKPVQELKPTKNSYVAAMEASVRDWIRAIDTFGASWLKNGLDFEVNVLGRDQVDKSKQLVKEADIIVTALEEEALVWAGVAINLAPKCVVSNPKFFVLSYTYADMYNINGQEFGHCLGLDHVYGSPNDDYTIDHEVMNGLYADSIGAGGTHLHCMSNLNVRGLERAYGGYFGQPSGGTASMPVAEYAQIDC